MNYANAVTVEFFEQVKCIGGLQTAESPGAVPGRQVTPRPTPSVVGRPLLLRRAHAGVRLRRLDTGGQRA